MKQCPNCQKQQPTDEGAFCQYCGAPLNANAPQPPAPPPVAPAAPGAYTGQMPAAPPPYGGQAAPGMPPVPGAPPPKKKGDKAVIIALACVGGAVLLGVLVFFVFRLRPGTPEVEAHSESMMGESASEASASIAEEVAAVVGVYETSPGYDPQYRPRFALNADGSFEGIANLWEGMGTCTGTYTVEGNLVYVTVTKADFFSPGAPDPWDKGWYAGAEEGTFEIIDKDTLRLVKPERFLGDTWEGDVFSRNDSADMEPPVREVYKPFDGEHGFVIDGIGGLHLREGPAVERESIVQIPEGKDIRAVGYNHVIGATADDTWYYVEYNDKTGWVNGAYVIWEGY